MSDEGVPAVGDVPAVLEASEAIEVYAADGDAPPARKLRPKRLAIILLSIALVLALGGGTYLYLLLRAANDRITEQNRELDEQRDLIDKKESFGAAMSSLLDTASTFEGSLVGGLVPVGAYTGTARLAWSHRWDGSKLDKDIATIRDDQAALEALIANAQTQLTNNGTGSAYESVTDELGKGFVASVIEDADALCQDDVLACVLYEDPLTVHFDAADNAQPFMNDYLRTGVAYHEFAHVLQMTNPAETEPALDAFGGDLETMADCFALTYVPGWTLDHRIYVDSYSYYDVSIGYGYTCDAAQAQVVRDWYDSLGFELDPISQER